MEYLISSIVYVFGIFVFYFSTIAYLRHYNRDWDSGFVVTGIIFWPITACCLVILGIGSICWDGLDYVVSFHKKLSVYKPKKTLPPVTDKLLEERTEEYRKTHCKECGHQL